MKSASQYLQKPNIYERVSSLRSNPFLMSDKKFIVYITTDHGNGIVAKIGEYEDIEDIEIHCGMFADDVVVTIEREKDNEKE